MVPNENAYGFTSAYETAAPITQTAAATAASSAQQQNVISIMPGNSFKTKNKDISMFNQPALPKTTGTARIPGM